MIKLRAPQELRCVIRDGLVITISCERSSAPTMTPSAAVAIATQIAPLLAGDAKRRQRYHGGTAPGRRSASAQKRMPTRDLLGAYCGLSGKTLEKAIFVVEAAERDPHRLGGIVQRMDETGNVDAAYRAALRPSTCAMLAARKARR